MKRIASLSRRAILGIALAGLMRHPASAHLVQTGLGPVYDGVAHLAVSPGDYVPFVGAALLAGLRGKASARFTILVIPFAWALGGLTGCVSGQPAFLPSWLAFIVIGGVVAADAPLSLGAMALLTGGLGFGLGYGNGRELAQNGLGWPGVLGSGGAIFVAVTLIAALVAGTTVTWLRVAWRVAGSWIAASGLLLLGWALR